MRQKEKIKFYLRRIYRNSLTLFKWGLFSVITGGIVGLVSTFFAYCLGLVTDYREDNLWLFLLLPVAGLAIVFLYGIFHDNKDRGTNMVLSTIHAETELPFKMAPLIFISTVITHLCGGSAGREGAALQLGGSIGNQIGRWFRMDDKDKRIVVMCGMSAAFSAVFGTPVAASIFAMEVVSVGVMYYAALVPCVFSSLIAWKVAGIFQVRGHGFVIIDHVAFQFVPSIKIIVLAVCCAGLSVLFCLLLHSMGDLLYEKMRNPYVRIVVAAVIIIGLTCILRTTDYMGTGVSVIARAMQGEARPEAFLLKMLFTALTIEAGFKGGEIVPSFFIGATFGCLFGQILGISPSMCAAVGMIAVFCGVTNCPVTSMLIAFELFGYREVPYFLIALSVSYLMSGYYGLYRDQTIVYSKYKTEYINRKAKD